MSEQQELPHYSLDNCRQENQSGFMALVSLQNVSIAFGGEQLLDQLSLHIEKNQRICLLGRNGTGKTTLLKIIAREIAPDSGFVHREPGLKISYFSQHIPQLKDIKAKARQARRGIKRCYQSALKKNNALPNIRTPTIMYW